MGKLEAVAARKSVLLSAQDSAVDEFGGGCYDDGVASVPPGDADEQVKIDAAVAAAVEPLNAQIAQDALDLQAAHAEADSKLADLSAKLDVAVAAKNADEQAILALQGSVAAVRAALDAIGAIAIPVP